MSIGIRFVYLGSWGAEHLEAELILENGCEQDIELQTLCFSSQHILAHAAFSESVGLERIGDLHRLLLNITLCAGQSLHIQITQKNTCYRNLSDFPAGFYALDAQGQMLALIDRTERPSYAGSSTISAALPQQAHEALWPQPKSVSLGEDTRPMPLCINVTEVPPAWRQIFRDLLPEVQQSLAVGLPIRLASHSHNALHFRLSHDACSISFPDEQFDLRSRGLSLLAQMLYFGSQGAQLRTIEIEDEPFYGYRGIHLDVVRHFFNEHEVSRYLQYAALYGFNQFHWHLSDDEGWRLQLECFPQLTEIGAWRGEGLALAAQMGSGGEAYGGFYTQASVTAIVQLAGELGINVIPEIDLPGHARALLKSLPQLQEPADQSKYQSVQHYNDNVLNPLYADNTAAIETILREVCSLFPSPLIHLGSDEIPKGAWQESPTIKAMDLSPEQVHARFFSSLEHTLQSLGKTAAGWEEIRSPQGVSQATWVYSWQGEEAGQLAAEQGHPVVLTPAQYCYMDLADNCHELSPGYYWAGCPDLKLVSNWQPFSHPNVKGIQLCLWSELLDSWEKAEYMLFPRLLSLANTAWNYTFSTDFDECNSIIGQQQYIILALGCQFKPI